MLKDNASMAELILDSITDGLYVCNNDRRIVYWSKPAERITGWRSEDVVGHRCMDNILCHVDKDGRTLCSEEICPLHRCIVTNSASTCPVIIYGQTKNGGRVPMVVSVAPVHDSEGKVIGGVESFHDLSKTYFDLERAKRIQTLSLEHDLPLDGRVSFDTFYLPHDMIGGDYFAIRQLDADHYGFFLADVMGHGVAAALHTVHLSSLWRRYYPTVIHPSEFAVKVNRELCKVVKGESFATAVCGVLNAANKTVRFASAGNPPLVVLRADGTIEQLDQQGLPFGVILEAEYDESEFSCLAGDCLLMFTDGAVEIQNADGQMLETEGLIGIIDGLEIPKSEVKLEALQKALVSFSNGILLSDDLTLLKVLFN
jgi:sigma-B regulation protein RsbU (phosphoserine phosphatase)